MPLQVTHPLAVEIKHAGVLALIGVGEVISEGKRVAHFVLQSTVEKHPLGSYMLTQPSLCDSDGILFQIWERDRFWVDSAEQPNVRHMFFELELPEPLRNPRSYLHAVAKSLRTELVAAEDQQLSMHELDDELSWADRNYGSKRPMPNFRRPRHTSEE